MSAAVLTPPLHVGSVDDPIVVELPTPAENKFRILYQSSNPESRLSVGNLVDLYQHDEQEVSSASTVIERDVSSGPPPLPVEVPQDQESRGANEQDTRNSQRSPPPPATTYHPLMPRSASLPVPVHLENPYRRLAPPYTKPVDAPEDAHFQDLSLELADSVQMIIQTMVQICPSEVLLPAKEQLAACALAIPTPSMSAIITSLKSLNYIAANLMVFARADDQSYIRSSPPSAFDIGELLQNAGDVLSGVSASAGVELVLFHADVDLKHWWVKGDEPGLNYAITHVVRQILTTSTQVGDSLEFGLQARPGMIRTSTTMDPYADETTPPPDEPEEALQCTIEISHSYPASNDPSDHASLRPLPELSTPVLQRLLRKVGATLTQSASPSDRAYAARRTWEITFTLPRATPPTEPLAAHLSGEPSLEQLKRFAENDLRGKKVRLYASTHGSFAHHLTSYLTSWGMDVGHGLDLGTVEEVTESPPNSPLLTATGSSPTAPTTSPKAPSKPLRPPPFILIDDDVDVLRERLEDIRRTPYTLKRPSMQRTASTNSVPRTGSHHGIPNPSVIVYFTSLSDFKHVKDIVQGALSNAESAHVVPEIMIIPKPAGPRRLLATLHSAITKPVVNGFFNALSASPNTPSTNVLTSPFFSPGGMPGIQSPKLLSGISSSRPPLSKSEHGSASPIEAIPEEHIPQTVRIPPSPLSVSESVTSDYVTAESTASSPPVKETPVALASTKQLGVSPSSGFLTPQGIYFGVKGGVRATPETQLMLRESGSGPNSVRSPISGRSSSSYMSPRPPRGSPSQEYFPKTASRRSSGANSELLKNTASPPVSPKNLPVRRQSGKAQENLKAIPPISVLIVEDNTINQTILSTFMKRNKIRYDVANNGKEAVEKWKKGKFHLILMDIQMPIMDGMAATRQIRELEKQNAFAGFPPRTPMGLRTPSDARTTSSPFKSSVIIVALTASSMPQDRVDALAAGCNDFLTKPVSLKWLNNKIIEWGSIKALQMYGDTEQEILKSQVMKAANVAEALQLPKARSHTPSPMRSSSSSLEHKIKKVGSDATLSGAKSPLGRSDEDGSSTPTAASFAEASASNNDSSDDVSTTDDEERQP